jgi:ketosteroid isomerase-like protein
LIDEWSDAVRRKDMAGILRHHAPDMTMYDVPPPLRLKGVRAYEDSWPQFFASSPTPPVFEVRELDVTAGADVAFAVALMRCVVIERGAACDLDFRLTLGFRRIHGQWTFIHEHHSIPATS